LTFPRRGEVHWTNLDPAFGTEIAKWWKLPLEALVK